MHHSFAVVLTFFILLAYYAELRRLIWIHPNHKFSLNCIIFPGIPRMILSPLQVFLTLFVPQSQPFLQRYTHTRDRVINQSRVKAYYHSSRDLNSRKSDYDESSSQRSFKENRRRKLSDSTVGLPNRNKQDSTQNISYIQNGGQSRQSFTEQRFEHAPLVESPQTTILCMVEQASTVHDIDAIITSYLQDYTTSSTLPTIPNTTNSSRRFIPSSDSSTSPHRQDTNVIRLLGTRKAYSSMLQFLRRQPKPHPSHAIYEYTAAISILGQAVDDPTYRSMAHGLFDEMIHLGITPNSYTCTALFLAMDGGKAVWTWYQRIQQLYLQQERIVEVHVFNAAIFACSRPSKSRDAEELQQQEEEDSGWQTALMIFNEMRKNKVMPNEQTFASLIHTCAKYGQVRVALSLLDEMKKKTHKGGRGQETNIKVWSAILSAFASAGDSNTVWTLILEMIQRGNRPHTLHYNSLLSALAREGKDTMALHVLNGMIHGTVESIVSHSTSLESIEQDMSVSNMTMKTGNHHMTPSLSRPDIVSFNTVMSALTQPGNKNYPEAKKLLELLKSGEYVNAYGEEVRPDIITYNTLLSACDEPKEAIEIIREIHLSKRYRYGQIIATAVTYTNAISVCKRATEPDLESALHLLESAKMNGVNPNVFMYSAVIWTAERKGNWEIALSILQEMKDLSQCKPNAITYDGVISSLASRGKAKLIFELFHEMRLCNIKPSAYTYQKIAQAASKLNVDESIRFLDEVISNINHRDLRIEMSSSIIESQIRNYGSMGRFQDALRTYTMIQGPVDTNCLNAIMSVCATSSPARWKDALFILHNSDIFEDSAGPAKINSRALNYAIFACTKADQWNEAINLLKLYATKGNVPLVSVEAINSVIASAGRNGRPDVSLSILYEMAKNYSVYPDSRSYRSAIMACNQAEHMKQRQRPREMERTNPFLETQSHLQWWEAALSLFRRMMESSLIPDIQTYSSVISACEAAGQWQRALGILRSMSFENNEGPLPNLYCFNAAIAACEKGGAWVEALDLYERLRSSPGNVQPNFITLNSLLISLENAGQRELAASIYQDALRDGILSPWKYRLDFTGTRVSALDLHQFSAPLAKTAIRSVIESLLLHQAVHDIRKDLIIIVGKGNGSDRGKPILSPLVQKILLDEFDIASEIEEWNSGRVRIRGHSLAAFVQAKAFRV